MSLSVCMMHLFSLESPVPCFCHHLYAEKCLCLGAVVEKKKVNFQNNQHFPTKITLFDIYSAFSSRSKDLVTLTM